MDVFIILKDIVKATLATLLCVVLFGCSQGQKEMPYESLIVGDVLDAYIEKETPNFDKLYLTNTEIENVVSFLSQLDLSKYKKRSQSTTPDGYYGFTIHLITATDDISIYYDFDDFVINRTRYEVFDFTFPLRKIYRRAVKETCEDCIVLW